MYDGKVHSVQQIDEE